MSQMRKMASACFGERFGNLLVREDFMLKMFAFLLSLRKVKYFK